MRGHTLVELVFVLLLLGVTASTVAQSARRVRDRASVDAAREAVVGLLAEARAAAIEHGEATVRISGRPWLATVLTQGSTLRRVALTSDFGVELELGGAGQGGASQTGADAEVELHYDALGLGRMAGQTLLFRRGAEEGSLVVSSYGRVRRR